MKKFKNLVKTTFQALFIFSIFFIAPGIAGNIETHYNRIGIVTATDNMRVVVEDSTGNIWEFEGDDFAKGDKVIMKMFTNYTDDNIHDDEIEAVQKV